MRRSQCPGPGRGRRDAGGGSGRSSVTSTPAYGSKPFPWSAEAARDRLSSTAFLAALFHGILILGVTFGSGPFLDRNTTSSMEVVLVTAEYEDREPPPSAVLLAQQNLTGAGNAAPDATLRTAIGHQLPAAELGPVQPGAEADQRAGNDPDTPAMQPLLTARLAEERIPDPGERDQPSRPRQTTLPAAVNAIELVGRMADANLVPEHGPRELLISANTRESRIASYLNVWKRRVEQVGTLNYPRAVSRPGQGGYPVLEVAIRADGTLKEVVLRTSSGERGLDQAALDILRMSAPFEPFPESLRGDYDVLRFAYEWRFSEGAARVRTAAGG
jgi:protein TonB